MSLYFCSKILVLEDGWKNNIPMHRSLPTTKEEIAKMFSLRTYDVLKLCLGDDLMRGQRFRHTSARKGFRYSVAGIMANYLNDALARLRLPMECDLLSVKEAKQTGYDRNHTVKLFNEDAEYMEPEYITFQTEACEVPKVIERSPVDGERIVDVKASRNFPITAFVPLRKTYAKFLRESLAKETEEFARSIRFCEQEQQILEYSRNHLEKTEGYTKKLALLARLKAAQEVFCGQFINVEVCGEVCPAEVLEISIEDDDITILYDIGNVPDRISMKESVKKWELRNTPQNTRDTDEKEYEERW